MARCCLNVVITSYDGEDLVENTLSTSPVYDGDTFIGYSVGEGELSFQLQFFNPEDGTWHLTNSSGSTILFEAYGLTSECPVSTDWTDSHPSDEIVSMYTYSFPCDLNIVESPNTIPDLNPLDFITCKYQNLLKKQKSILSKEVADMKTAEVFGLKSCDEGWEKIYEKYLIIKALECCPYDEYSLADEKCLIGHLTDNCNC